MKLIIYGSDICGDCLDTKAYLQEHADKNIHTIILISQSRQQISNVS